ncbi:MAG TPA: alkaline phosphatase family protein [Mycobacteriales bacterium]|nr:alkaline phosphatase family protein [Mycobacteriales bacterium]
MDPAYGTGALSDVTPSIMTVLGVPGGSDAIALPPARHVVLLVIDGLGWNLLRQHAADAPFLAGLEGGAITAGFPSTTAASLASIGTGLPPGGHGIVGLAFEVGEGIAMNALGWATAGDGRPRDLRDRFVPEDVQPVPTVFERLAAHGVAVRVILPVPFVASGLTRAVLRGGEGWGVRALGDLAAAAVGEPEGDRTFRYAYHGDLDLIGHVYGPGTDPWRLQLTMVDQLARTIAEHLPPDGVLLVTADHGMVHVDEADRIDADERPDLLDGVRLLAGEPRVRHVYAEPGAAADVLAGWREQLAGRATVLSRAEAIAAGWFGPVQPRVEPRIGDVVVACTGSTIVTRTEAEPVLSALTGQHGALTEDELLIPLLRTS